MLGHCTEKHPGHAQPSLKQSKLDPESHFLDRYFPERYSKTYMCPREFPQFDEKDEGKLAEKEVFDLFSQLDEPMVVIHSFKSCVFRVGETDIIICHKKRGIMLFEVKSITNPKKHHRFADEFLESNGQLHDSVTTIKYALRKLKMRKKKIRYAVAMPNVSIDTFNRDSMLNKEHLASKDALQKWLDEFREPLKDSDFSDEEYDKILLYFAECHPATKNSWHGIHDYLNKLTPTQAKVLIGLYEEFYISGPAGSGKTEVMIHNAGENQLSGQRKLVVVFHRALADYVEWRLESITNVDVKTFRGLLVGITTTTYSYESYVKKANNPVLVNDAITILKDTDNVGIRDKYMYDSIFVDEAQDMEGQWEVLIDLLHNKGARHLKRLFFDDNQVVSYSRPPRASNVNVYHLTEVIRNPKNVFETSKTFYQSDRECRVSHGCNGPEVVWNNGFTDHDLEHFSEPVLNYIYQCIEEMWNQLRYVSPRDICILVENGVRAESLRKKIIKQPQNSNIVPFDCKQMVHHYKDGAWPLDQIPQGKCGVTVDSVSIYKGHGSKAVILMINTKNIEAKLQEKLYVGITRASCKLVVIMSKDGIKHLEEEIGKSISATISELPMDVDE